MVIESKPVSQQEVCLVVYKPREREAIVLEHSPVNTPSGDLQLRGPLDRYTFPANCPTRPGLYVISGMVHVIEPMTRVMLTINSTELAHRVAEILLGPYPVKPIKETAEK